MGVPYTYKEDDLNNPLLAQADGICQLFGKEIVVRKTEYLDGNTTEEKAYRKDRVLRHELVHAIAEECGVRYGDNEDLVDWIAHIIPIVEKAFNEVKAKGEEHGIYK